MTNLSAEDNTGTVPVQERHRFDEGRLAAYMQEHVEGFSGALRVEEFAGGQSNPTYLLSAGGERYVMRRKPEGILLKSAHAVDREYRVLKALGGTDVPVPRVFALCQDEDVIGTWFYIMEYQDGKVHWEVNTGDYTPQERGQLWFAALNAQAKLHMVDFESVGLSDFGRHSDYIARQLKRWCGQYEYTKTVDNPYMNKLIAWLPENIPPDDECAIVHGDYKFNNLMMHATRFEVIGILDWELSTLGHPISDFAYLCMAYRSELVGQDLNALGIPDEEDYVARYCELTGRSGIDPDDWNYYIAFNMFRLAAISQGIARRVLDGTAKSAQADQAGSRAIELSKLACQQIDSG